MSDCRLSFSAAPLNLSQMAASLGYELDAGFWTLLDGAVS